MAVDAAIPTQCVPCGKVLSSPSAAVKHITKHPKVRRSGRSKWGSGFYVDGETWGAYSNQTDPPNHAQNGVGEGLDSGISESPALSHSLLRYDQTACICDDHYPKTESWRMTVGGREIGPHRHSDRSGRCVTCGAER